LLCLAGLAAVIVLGVSLAQRIPGQPLAEAPLMTLDTPASTESKAKQQPTARPLTAQSTRPPRMALQAPAIADATETDNSTASASRAQQQKPEAATAAPQGHAQAARLDDQPELVTGASANPADAKPRRTFAGRPIEPVDTIEMEVTAYSPDARSCGKWADGQTASGYSVWTNGGKLAAADTDLLPFGSIITVPGYHAGKPIPVLDRGGAIQGRRLDLLFPTHSRARQWGRQTITVTVWQYAD
jgi:3D (Asp-Asp-Asp) domain-containing protein